MVLPGLLRKQAMATPFKASSKPVPFTAASVINKARTVFGQFPDIRKTATGNNLKYAVADAAMSAFGIFFTQSPSFPDYRARMQKKHGKSNAQSILGIHKLPGMNQVRNLPDPVPPTALYPLLQETNDGLYHHGCPDAFRSPNNTPLMPGDGTDFFASEKIPCPCCTCKL